MRVWSRTINVTLLLATALTAVAAVVIAGYVAHDGVVLSVESGSMTPVVRKGDAVFVRRIPGYVPSAGDIVSYHSPIDGRTITHRVVSVSRQTGIVVTKGDNLVTSDPSVSMSALRGQVTAVFPHAGQGLDMVRHPVSIVAFVYVPAVALCACEVQKSAAHYRKPHYRLIRSVRNSV
jgi:signal peptidase I